MNLTGAQLVVRALEEEGVRHGFGIPGTHNIELYDAMADAANFQPILVTDEQSASFMADGYARAGNGLAVVNIVPGAGLTHALSGIAEAFLDGVPMLILSCGIRRDTGAAFQLHDIDQVAVARPVCKQVHQPRTHVDLYHALRTACHQAREAPAGPVLVEVPANLYLFAQELREEDLRFSFAESRPRIDASIIEKIAGLINGRRSVGIYAGRGARHASDLLISLADHIDALVFTTISGKGVFPDNHARFAWNLMGASAPKEIRRLGDDLDGLIAIGCRFGEVATASYGMKPPVNLVHIDIDSRVFNKNYPAKMVLQADAKEALEALLASPTLKRKGADTMRLSALAEAHGAAREKLTRPSDDENKVSPHAFFAALQNQFGPETIFATDSGNGTFLAMEHLRLDGPNRFLGPIDYSCMGYGVPAAIGAKLACPNRPVVALVGDGAFLMTGMELLTAAQNGTAAVFCILRDGELSQIAQFQQVALNRITCSKLPSFDLKPLAAALGVDYLKIENDREIDDALKLSAQSVLQAKPVLVEVNIDYSQSTFFSQGVVKTNFLRFPWKDRIRFVARVLKRKLS